jgi:hypothetical protein
MAGNIRTFIGQMRYWANLENPGVGYDQNIRWNLKNGGSVDCSSFVISCLKIAGFNTGKASFTGNMRAELTKHGWKVKANDGKPEPGDILLNDADHTAVFLGRGLLAQASINEHGGTTGGTPGNQTGRETYVRNYYDFPWNCYLRFGGPQPPQHQTLQLGSKGPRVRHLKQGLNRVFPSYSQLVVNGEFDARTKAVVEEFQTRVGLCADGVVDAHTTASLKKFGVVF